MTTNWFAEALEDAVTYAESGLLVPTETAWRVWETTPDAVRRFRVSLANDTWHVQIDGHFINAGIRSDELADAIWANCDPKGWVPRS